MSFVFSLDVTGDAINFVALPPTPAAMGAFYCLSTIHPHRSVVSTVCEKGNFSRSALVIQKDSSTRAPLERGSKQVRGASTLRKHGVFLDVKATVAAVETASRAARIQDVVRVPMAALLLSASEGSPPPRRE